jgi:hypothetical protein
MFERLTERAVRKAERRTQSRIDRLATEIEASLPAGIRCAAAPEGVRLSGRGLRRRFTLDPALRWLTAALR